MAARPTVAGGPFWSWAPPSVTYKRAKDIDPLKPGREGRLLPNVAPQREAVDLNFSEEARRNDLADMMAATEGPWGARGSGRVPMDATLRAAFAVPGRRERIRRMLMDDLYAMPSGMKYRDYIDFITEDSARAERETS